VVLFHQIHIFMREISEFLHVYITNENNLQIGNILG
jgi:hypothetical protein